MMLWKDGWLSPVTTSYWKQNHYWVWSPWSGRPWSSRCWWGETSWTRQSAGRPTGSGHPAERTLVTTSDSATWGQRSEVEISERSTSVTHLKAKYCILIPCLASCFSTSGSTSLILACSRTIMAWMPVEESSRVLMKKSLMSDIKFVKQKEQSASAWS